MLRRVWDWARRSGGESRSLAVELGWGRGSDYEGAPEGRYDGCVKVEIDCRSVVVAARAVVVVVWW